MLMGLWCIGSLKSKTEGDCKNEWKYVISKDRLNKYLRLEITDEELFESIPDGANIAAVTEPETTVYVTKYHVKNLLEKPVDNSISIEWAVDFAETMVLTFLFDWDESNPDEEHEIVFNILYELESIEEEEHEYGEEDFREMLDEISKIC